MSTLDSIAEQLSQVKDKVEQKEAKIAGLATEIKEKGSAEVPESLRSLWTNKLKAEEQLAELRKEAAILAQKLKQETDILLQELQGVLDGTAAAAARSVPGAAGPTSSSTSESRVESLLKLFSQQQLPNTVADNLAKRSGPIRPNSSGQINNVGQHFPLVGIQSSVDHLIKVLSHMHRRFKSGDDDEFFLEGLQLLRAVGGPGTGKSTLLRNIWGLLQQRIQEVKDSAADRDRELWEQWKYWEVPELQERMQAWGPYPWVYVISLDATSGLQELLVEEQHMLSSRCLALRMLFGIVGSLYCNSYSTFFKQLHTNHPHLLELQPLDVMKFIQALHGVDSKVRTIAVWAFDEVNAVPAVAGQPTWFQKQLSAAMTARQTALTDPDFNMMPVYVTAGTRASAMSMRMTASRKSRVQDIRLPTFSSLQEQQLMVMDVIRRLPCLDSQLDSRPPTLPGPDGSLADLNDQQKQRLVQCCPPVLSEVLQWCGNLFRAAEYTVAVCGGNHQGNHVMIGPLPQLFSITPRLCLFSCCYVNSLPQLFSTISTLQGDDVIQAVASQLPSNWLKYTTAGGVRHQLALAAFAYSITRIPVSRATELVTPESTSAISVQQLEADGMILLVSKDTDEADIAPWRDNKDSDDHSSNQPGDADMGAVEPDEQNNFVITLPPILMHVLQQKLEAPTGIFQQKPQLPLLQALADSWCGSEITDVSTLAMRLQLYRSVFKQQTVLLRDLHPGFAGGSCDVRVSIPIGGFAPSLRKGSVTPVRFADLVEKATPSRDWLCMSPDPSGPADSWLVLFETESDTGLLTNKRVVINIQSKLHSSVKVIGSQALLDEVMKVPILNQTRCRQAMLYVSDQLPSNELTGQVRKVGQNTQQPQQEQQRQLQQRAQSGQQQEQLRWCGRKRAVAVLLDGATMDVVLVLGDEQHLYRGATMVVKQAVERIKRLKQDEEQEQQLKQAGQQDEALEQDKEQDQSHQY